MDIILTLQDEMGVVGEWLRANKLSLNVNKTKFVIIGSPCRTASIPDVKLTVFGSEIESVVEMKYLGVNLDKNLNFNSHIEFLMTKNQVKSWVP